MPTGWFGGDLDTVVKTPVTGWWAEIAVSSAPSGASLSLTGGTPAIRVSKTVVPGGASLTVTGASPTITITQNKTVTPSGAALTVIGSHPALGVTLRPPGSAVAITGGVPVVRLSDNKMIQPSGGSLAVTSGTPVVTPTLNQFPTPTGAPLTITGGIPVVTASDHKTVTPSGAALTVTGGTPVPSVGNGFTPNPAALTLTGGTPVVSTPVVVTPTGASMTVVGSHPALGITLRPSSAAITVTGGTPAIGVSDNKMFTPTGAPIALTGGTPVVTITDNKLAMPTGGTLTVTGGTPVVAATANKFLSPTGATLTVTGGTPTIAVSDNKIATPMGASLIVTGATPTVAVVSSGPPWTDDFNRADGGLGSDWDDTTGSASTGTIVSNAWVGPINGLTGNTSRYLKTATTSNVGMSATVKGAFQYPSDILAFFLRANTIGNAVNVYVADFGSGVQMTILDHLGSFIESSAVITPVDGDILAAEIHGNVVTGYLNGSMIVQYTDASYVNSGSPEKAALNITRDTSNGDGTTGTPSTFLGANSITVYESPVPPQGPLNPTGASLTLTGGTPTVTVTRNITIQGTTQAAAATSVTIPTHAVGELIVISAWRANATIATKPTAASTVPAWVDIDAGAGANVVSIRTAYFVATATNHTSGTWTNAQGMTATVLKGQAASSFIGGHAVSNNASASGSVSPSITLAQTDGSSAILDIHGAANGLFTTATTPPTGYTRKASASNSCVNTKTTTTSDGSVTQTQNASGANSATQIEIRQH